MKLHLKVVAETLPQIVCGLKEMIKELEKKKPHNNSTIFCFPENCPDAVALDYDITTSNDIFSEKTDEIMWNP